MTTTKEDRELDELNAWIAEHVMGWRRVDALYDLSYGQFYVHAEHGICALKNITEIGPFKPATDPAAAMGLLAKCAEKCAVGIRKGDKWDVYAIGSNVTFGIATTLPLAICLFAKSLFSKKAQGGE